MQSDALPPGAAELREDAPLKAGAAAGWCAGGPRLVLGCFAALSAAITLALATQIYSGDYEVVPHGSVASSAAACSRAGTDALKEGGRALDAAAAAALCLAVTAPHATSLDASGALLYWEYRRARAQPPTRVEWGGTAAPGARPPRLVAALAALHAEWGALPWPRLLQPAIDLARNGFPVSEGLARALAAGATPSPAPAVGSLTTAPELAAYLERLQRNTSAELSQSWGSDGLRRPPAATVTAGAVRAYAAGARADPALRALALALDPPPADVDEASRRVAEALAQQATRGEWGAEGAGGGAASGLAVADRLDTYLALVTGLSQPFGSGPTAAAGWQRDEPAAPPDLAPGMLVAGSVCGARSVLGAEAGAALAAAGAALGAGAAPAAVELARPGPPGAAVNVVQQTGDALRSHADSRGGGLASRF